MSLTEDILIRIRGQDSTGSTFSNVEKKAESMGSTLKNAAGMAMGMIGYDLASSVAEAGREAINARGQLDYFGQRLGFSAEETKNFRGQIDNLQKDFRKVDMSAVGATAEEIAVKMDLPKEKVGDLTKMTAVLSSTFVKEGRTQEDAVLAVSDAMDGQFKRLQEIGITKEELMKNGWNGNLEDEAGLIDALNQTMTNKGYEQTAKDITSLDEAWGALTVAGGNLIADVLIPITPLIVDMANALMGAIDFVKDNGWAQGALLIGALTIGFGLFAGALSIAAAAEGGLLALMPGFITSLYGAASGFMAITVAGAPLWAIVAVIAALALAVYEVGIYFGWWTDVGSMLAAISDGVRRLWEAFINSPQVQGAIRAVQNALNQLWVFIQPVISWIQTQWANIFGESGSQPDVVHMIIEAFEQLGNIASAVFGTLASWAGAVFTALSPIIEAVNNIFKALIGFANGTAPLERTVLTILTMMGRIYGTLGQLILRVGQMIFNGIINALRPIPQRIWQFLSQAAMRLLTFGLVAAVRARNAGMRILNGIVSFVRRIPGRVYAFMMQVPGRIGAAASSAVGAAASLASQVITAVTNGIVGVGDAVYNEFISIGTRINDSVSSAVSAAASFGDDIKNAVLGALGIASPGIIQKKIAIEFQDIPGRIGESNDQVYTAARSYSSNILNGFNAPPMNLGTLRQNAQFNPNYGGGNAPVVVNFNEGAFDVDARNFTDKEAQGILITAFESVSDVPTGGA